jgi:hypothetical protein
MRRPVPVVVLVLLAGALAGSRLSGNTGTADPSVAASGIYEAPPAAATPSVTPATPTATPSACDPTEQLFASMFIGLTNAALSNAGIDRDAFDAAGAADRATLKRYLEQLGISIDDAQLDALMQWALPSPSAPSSVGAGGMC